MTVSLPSLSEQREIAGILKTGSEVVEKLQAEIATVARQKRGLMQKLLTGEWRVKR